MVLSSCSPGSLRVAEMRVCVGGYVGVCLRECISMCACVRVCVSIYIYTLGVQSGAAQFRRTLEPCKLALFGGIRHYSAMHGVYLGVFLDASWVPAT